MLSFILLAWAVVVTSLLVYELWEAKRAWACADRVGGWLRDQKARTDELLEANSKLFTWLKNSEKINAGLVERMEDARRDLEIGRRHLANSLLSLDRAFPETPLSQQSGAEKADTQSK